jgi:Skp family chaperone for outer membrane proteins
MKRSIALAVLLASGLALTANAQTKPAAAPAAPAGPPKIAVIAFQTAVAQTNEFQRNFADLQAKFNPKRQQLKTLSDEIDTLKKQLQVQSATLSDAARADKARVIDDKQKELQRSVEDAQNDFQQEMQETFSGVASKVGNLMVSYAKEHGYTLVLDFSEQQTPVLYASPSTDITKAVVEAYNVKSGVPPPPPPVKPAAAAPKAPGTK